MRHSPPIGDAEPPHAPVEVRTVRLQPPRGLGHVAAGHRQRARDQHALVLVERVAQRAIERGRDRAGGVALASRRRRSTGSTAATSLVRHRAARRAGSPAARRCSPARARCPASRYARAARDRVRRVHVGAALARAQRGAARRSARTSAGMSPGRSRSGGTVDRNHVQPEEQVLAERAVGDRAREILVRRRDDAHVDADRLAAADALDLLRLDRAQQLRLRLGAQVADLVEEAASP